MCTLVMFVIRSYNTACGTSEPFHWIILMHMTGALLFLCVFVCVVCVRVPVRAYVHACAWVSKL